MPKSNVRRMDAPNRGTKQTNQKTHLLVPCFDCQIPVAASVTPHSCTYFILLIQSTLSTSLQPWTSLQPKIPCHQFHTKVKQEEWSHYISRNNYNLKAATSSSKVPSQLVCCFFLPTLDCKLCSLCFSQKHWLYTPDNLTLVFTEWNRPTCDRRATLSYSHS